jgi:N-acyl-D-aspartate/D-glutamate deacylase
MYTQMFRFGNPPNYMPKRHDSIAAMAERQGRTAPDVAYDVLIEEEGRNFIYAPLVNYFDFDLSASEAMLANPNSIMGLGDGGAHVGFILDAGYPTWMMTHWGRGKRRWSVQEIIRRLTSDPAGAAGLGDRGILAVGMKADVNVIDYDKVGFDRPYVTFDLPAGGRRLLQRASGYEATIVSGAVTYRRGEPTGNLPGRIVKGQRGPTAQARMAAAE